MLRGGEKAKEEDAARLPLGEPPLSQLVGLQVLSMRGPRAAERDRWVIRSSFFGSPSFERIWNFASPLDNAYISSYLSFTIGINICIVWNIFKIFRCLAIKDTYVRNWD